VSWLCEVLNGRFRAAVRGSRTSTLADYGRSTNGCIRPKTGTRHCPLCRLPDILWLPCRHRWVIGGIILGLAIVIRVLAGADLKQSK
jgi:hypothetical protein